MKILIAPDSFKGSNSSLKVAEAIEEGVCRVFPEAVVEKVPIGDGGEGTVDALVEANEGEIITLQVNGPLGHPVDSFYGIVDEGTAVIEMAAASGLDLLPEHQRDVLRASTYGTGQLIMHALEQGVEEIILAIGGSATNDGGTGMAAALGYRFLDDKGEELPPGGAALQKLASIDDSRVDPRVRKARFRVACDVNNPLLGERGASAVYGPQKGAGPQDVQTLDAALKQLSKVVELQFGQKVDETPGAGAAGGLGYGLLVFCGATLEKGIDIVLDAVNFDERLENKDMVITGEGKIDGQTAYGKVPIGIAYRAKQKGVPVLVIAGDIGDGIEAVYDKGIDAVMSTVNRAMSLEEAMGNSRALLIDGAERAMRMIRMGMDLC
ncbi:MAG: glycerate kinase [Spirochaetia bacterium]|nr:glycerate kinase [Spirochaetia bacterium]